jgi:hypothetical protein
MAMSKAFESTTRAFGDAVAQLNEQRSTTNGEEYKRLRIAADVARMKSEEARLTLDRHIVDHGC